MIRILVLREIYNPARRRFCASLVTVAEVAPPLYLTQYK